MYKLKDFLGKLKKKAVVFVAAALACGTMAVATSAAETTGGETALGGASEQIMEQFTGAAADITPIILGILGAGLGIFVIFVSIKLGKKMFTTVAK